MASDTPTSYNTSSSIAAARNTTGYYTANGGSAVWSSPSGISASLQGGIVSALPFQFKQDVTNLSNLTLGTFLQNHKKVNGSEASIINGIMGLVKETGNGASSTKVTTPNFSIDTRFIPIILKTEFNLASSTDDSSTTRQPWYVIFDSTPESFSFSKNASWIPKDFPGRPEPIQVYSNSGAQTFSLEGLFFAESQEKLLNKIGIANRLNALVTPSKAHFMPTPVEVRIGTWKRLRCIVNSVVTTYEGPWWLGPKNSSTSTSSNNIPTHTPYMYKAQFNFTVTSEYNYIQYAEDILDVGDSGGYASGTTAAEQAQIINEIAYQASTGFTFNSGNDSTINVTTTANTQGVQDVVLDQASANIDLSATTYLSNLGLPTDTNGAAKTGAMAKITSGLTTIVQQSILRNIPQINKL